MYVQIFLGLLIWFSLGSAVALVFAAVAAKQDAEPINPDIPPGAAFVRVANATAPGHSLLVKLANFDFGNLNYSDTSLYRQVCEGTRLFQIGNKQKLLTVVAGNYYTLNVTGVGEDQQIFLVKDTVNVSPAESEMATNHRFNQPVNSKQVPSHSIDIDVDDLDHGPSGVA